MGQDTLPSLRRQFKQASFGCLAYNLLQIIRDPAFGGESVKPSMDFVIRQLVKVGARVVCHAGRWYVPHCVGFFLRSLLSHSILLSLQPGVDGVQLNRLWGEVCRQIAKISSAHV